MNSFYSVAQKGLDKASPEEVREVAVSVWHQQFTPSFSELTDLEALRTAGYLVDFLSRFHCVEPARKQELQVDRKSTRLNSSHVKISYAVFCLKKKKQLTWKIRSD